MELGELIAGRYELLKRLGRGGMGEVWAARDRTLHRDVAIKLLDLDGAGHPELPQRFEREAVAAAQINHPNVVALHDRGVHEDMLFLVMEKVEGATLSEHIYTEQPIPLARALEIAGGICTALAAAHQAHVIHYDIKPQNVMLTPDGRVKVVDFGIAGFVQATFTVARSSQLTPAGTVEYGAPEQFLTERGDERSDLYALGGVLFAMLARRPPFTGHNGIAVMRRKLDEEAPRLDSLRPDLPTQLTALVAELLQRDPDRRPQSAQQVHERLRQLQAAFDPTNEGTSDLPTTVVQPPRTGATQQPPGADGPFSISWTGKEPKSAYSDTRPLRARIITFAILLPVAMVGGFILVAKGIARAPHAEGLGIAGLFLILFGMFMLLGLLTNIPDKSAWSLRVGPLGIRTTKGLTKHEYLWNQVQTFAIEEVVSSTYRCSAGLHVKFAKGSKSRNQLRPPGWPYGQDVLLRNGMVPVCVLGPMTDQQRTALKEALARYGQSKSDTEAWGE
ncbi:protein kinase [Streptomyces sp. NPDC052721]|uniref:protein kinase domain-containing protein n=1 Tax=Streptomyces sp. NPDC052721 TaxID=3154955 RepID=UPI003435FDBC